MTGPLEGMRVVTLAGLGPVAFTGMLLADMGAHVVRIARPGGRNRGLPLTEGVRPEQDVVNRGVDTVELDLRDPAGLRDALALLDRAEVLAEGYRPGVAERLGLGPQEVLARNPALVYARLTGYGQDGPLADRAGHDINYLAQSGALHGMARRGEAPRPPLNLLGDYAGGGTTAAFGIVCAVLESRRSGRGQVIDAAMVDGVAQLTAKLHGLRSAGELTDEPGTSWLDSGAPFYDTYRCADGGYVAVGALEPDFYRELTSRLEVDLADWPAQDDRARWPELRERLTAEFARRTRDEWAAVYAGTDACVTAVLTYDEAAADPHNVARGVYRRIGDTLHPNPAPRFGRTPAREPGPPHPETEDVRRLLDAWGAAAASAR